MTARFQSLTTSPTDTTRTGRRGKFIVVTASVGTVVVMVALTFAAVPLYRLFCQVTGFGGTTQVAAAAPGAASALPITVRFDANVAPALPWHFTAPDPVEVRQVTYTAVNVSGEPVLGTAVFNVTPLQLGQYFYKIECFCFTEQLLTPGERKEFPVSFFVDPAIAEDSDGRSVAEITLSYTFYNKGRAALDDYVRRHPAAVTRADGSSQ